MHIRFCQEKAEKLANSPVVEIKTRNCFFSRTARETIVRGADSPPISRDFDFEIFTQRRVSASNRSRGLSRVISLIFQIRAHTQFIYGLTNTTKVAATGGCNAPAAAAAALVVARGI